MLSYLVVESETGNPLLATMAFTIGFVALLLTDSELFTESTLVPVSSVVAKVAVKDGSHYAHLGVSYARCQTGTVSSPTSDVVASPMTSATGRCC